MRPPGRPPKDAPPIPIEERTRECEWCGEYFAKPNVESWKRFRKRRFCSHDCYHESRSAA